MIKVIKDHKTLAATHFAKCKDHIQSVRNLYLFAFGQILADSNISYSDLRDGYTDRYLNTNSITAYFKLLYTDKQVQLKEDYGIAAAAYRNFLRQFTIREIEQLMISPYYSATSLDQLNTKWITKLYENYPEMFSLEKKNPFSRAFLDILNCLLDYDKFIGEGFGPNGGVKYDAYSLALALDVRVCPYCNRNFTLTVLNPKKVRGVRQRICRPQFDHLMSKSEHIFLSLSYYNLIPSCGICNHIKLDENIDPAEFIHPYFEGFEKLGKFVVRPLSVGSLYGINPDFEFDFETGDARVEKNGQIFFLKEIYHKHSDYICDLIKREEMVGPDLAAHLKARYAAGHVVVTDKEIHEFLYPMIKDGDARSRYPLSKFLSDIYESYMAQKP